MQRHRWHAQRGWHAHVASGWLNEDSYPYPVNDFTVIAVSDGITHEWLHALSFVFAAFYYTRIVRGEREVVGGEARGCMGTEYQHTTPCMHACMQYGACGVPRTAKPEMVPKP